MRGWTVTRVLEENDTSASGKKKRPLYENLLAMIEGGQVDVVIAYQMDRLTRSLSELEHLIDLSERTGVKVATAAGDIDLSTEAGRLVGRILASVARSEIEVKARRHRDAQAQAAAEGRRVGGRRPFGYEPDGVTIRPREAAAIRQGYEDLLAGLPLAEIARRWNALGFRSQSRPWAWNNVRVVLMNARYAGLRAHKKEVVGPAVWDGLVSEETWRAAVGVLTDPGRRKGAGPKRPLTGIAKFWYPYRSWGEWKDDDGVQACGARGVRKSGAAARWGTSGVRLSRWRSTSTRSCSAVWRNRMRSGYSWMTTARTPGGCAWRRWRSVSGWMTSLGCSLRGPCPAPSCGRVRRGPAAGWKRWRC